MTNTVQGGEFRIAHLLDLGTSSSGLVTNIYSYPFLFLDRSMVTLGAFLTELLKCFRPYFGRCDVTG